MKINKLYINHFGKISNKTINLTDGINVVSGENEAGKSTLHSFIKAMIFGLERGRGRAASKDDYTRFKPWDGGTYAGKIDVLSKGIHYSVSRNFDKDNQSCIVANETDFLEEDESKVREIFGGISPSSFQNTISVKQLSVGTGGELAEELKSHIINLRTAGAYTLNISGAVTGLKTKRKKAEGAYSKSVELEAEELNARIASMEEKLEKDNNASRLPKLEKEKENIEKEIYNLELKRGEISSKLNNSEDILRRAHIAEEQDIIDLHESVKELTDFYEAYNGKLSSKFAGKLLFIILSILSIAITLTSVFATIVFFLYKYENIYLFTSAAIFALSIVLDILFVKKTQTHRTFMKGQELLKNLYRNVYDIEISELSSEKIETIKNIPHKLKKAIGTVSESKTVLGRIQGELEFVRGKIEPLGLELEEARKDAWEREQKEEALFSLRERKATISKDLETNARIKKDIEALSLAIDTIENISRDVFESFGHFLQDTTSALIRSMTDGNYTGVVITDDLDISLVQGEREVDLSSVSGGTLDQVYLALRLACIEFMWPDESMPLLLDDTFAMYDDNRLSCTLEWLSENYSGQVIIFTCHRREEKRLTNLNIPFNLIEL